MRRFLRVFVATLVVLPTLNGCDAGSSSSSDDSPSGPPKALTCTPDNGVNVVTAPGGYYTNGASVCSADGTAHLFHGVDRPSLEWDSSGEWNNSEGIPRSDFAAMAAWHANVVRIALNQDFWLPGSTLSDPTYPARVDNAINWAEGAGMDVILDLHWSDRGVLGSCSTSCQQVMADPNSTTFWSDVAGRYKNDGRVLFELYNEPHDVTWNVWKSGGNSGQGWTSVGMQQLYAAVRATGADNLVIAGGLNYAFDLSGVPSNRITGYNILYATHPYNYPGKAPVAWDQAWGFLTATAPVIVTEFGDGSAAAGDGTVCASAYSQELITYADAHNASWTAWAWYPGGCKFPSVVSDWNGTPNAPGMVVKTALLGYHDPASSGTHVGTAGGDAGSAVGDGGGPPAGDAATAAGDASSQ